MSTDYTNRARRAIDEALRELAANLAELEQDRSVCIPKEGGDIGPTLYSLGEAYRSPSFHSVGQLAVCVEAFLRMRT